MGPVLFVQASAQMWVLSCVSPSVGKQTKRLAQPSQQAGPDVLAPSGDFIITEGHKDP